MKMSFLIAILSVISLSAFAKTKGVAHVKTCSSIQGQYEVVSVQCLGKDQQEVGNNSQPDKGQISFKDNKLEVTLTKKDKRFGGGSVDINTIATQETCLIEDVGARDVIDSLNGVRSKVLGAYTVGANQGAKLELRASAMELCPGNQEDVVSQVIELKRVEAAHPESAGPTQKCLVYGLQVAGEDKVLLEGQLDGENIIVGSDRCLRHAKSCKPESFRLRLLNPNSLPSNTGRAYAGWFYYRQLFMAGQPYTIEAGRISADGGLMPKQYGYPSFLSGYPGKTSARSKFEIECRQAH